jgi:putative hydrolase of the HAD superfamily
VEQFTCQKLGITEQQYWEAYRFGRTETKRQLSDVGASHNRLLYFQKTLEYLGVKPIPMSLQMYELYWTTFLDKMQLYTGLRELIDRLKEKGITIAVCTDLTAHIQHRKLKALGLSDDVSYLVTSEEAGREKPHPEIFHLCLEKLQLPAEEICFIGDSYDKDIEGAAAAGMQTVWFHPEQSSERQYEEIARLVLEGGGERV